MAQGFGVAFFGALFAIMNPLLNLSVFLSLTSTYSPAEQRRAAISVTLYSTIMCAVVAVVGPQILTFFGISVDDFRVAGGIVLAGIALNMLYSGGSSVHQGSPGENVQDPRDDIAFYPMTFPMIVGPGTITTLVVFIHQTKTVTDMLVYAGIVAAILAILGVVLYFSAAIGSRLSATLRVIVSRLMGMILLAIGVSMIAAGLKALLPGFA
ncbi:MAG: NAAT family transporter [Bauldia sp.]|nr:NAAT family transporter [Bauldia sp.]